MYVFCSLPLSFISKPAHPSITADDDARQWKNSCAQNIFISFYWIQWHEKSTNPIEDQAMCFGTKCLLSVYSFACVWVIWKERSLAIDGNQVKKINAFTKRTYKFIGIFFLMSWNPFGFTDCNSLCSAIVGCIDKLLLASVCAPFECSATQRCACALCLCSVPPTNEKKKGERDKKERRKKYRTKGTQNEEREKKRSSMKKGIRWCVCVCVSVFFRCAVGCIQIMTISRKTSALSQVITFFFFIHRCLISTRFFRSSNNNNKPKNSFAWAFTQLRSVSWNEREHWENMLQNYTTIGRIFFSLGQTRENCMQFIHHQSEILFTAKHDSHLEMFIVGYLPKAHWLFRNCLCKNDHRFTHTHFNDIKPK